MLAFCATGFCFVDVAMKLDICIRRNMKNAIVVCDNITVTL